MSETNSIANDHYETTLPYMDNCVDTIHGFCRPLGRTSSCGDLHLVTLLGLVHVTLHRDVPAPPLPVVMVPLGRRPVSALPHRRASSGSVLPDPAVRPAS